MEILNLKIVFIFILVLMLVSNSSASSTTTPSTSITLPIASPSNIIIVIDSTASTTFVDSTTGISFKDLIYQNALSIIQSVNRCSKTGIVVYGNRTSKTELFQIKNESDRLRLKEHILEFEKSYPISAKRITGIPDGLNASLAMLQEVDGQKEIIIITDGTMDKLEFAETMKTVEKIDNNIVKIYFVQALMAWEAFKKPYETINKLSQAANTESIVLNPDERLTINFINSTSDLDESCLTPTPTSTTTSTPMPTSTTVMDTPTINPTPQSTQQEIRTSWLEPSINSIFVWFKSIFYIKIYL